MKWRILELVMDNLLALLCFLFAAVVCILLFVFGFFKTLVILLCGFAGFYVGWCIEHDYNPFNSLRGIIERIKDE